MSSYRYQPRRSANFAAHLDKADAEFRAAGIRRERLRSKNRSFGNMTVSGNGQFQPGYNSSNQMMSLATYDANGNVSSDE
ncbi:MAG: hypothetical protein ACRD4R_04825 [Candidatus Acidiferrales bacterium]